MNSRAGRYFGDEPRPAGTDREDMQRWEQAAVRWAGASLGLLDIAGGR
jgi:hypothetical protein